MAELHFDRFYRYDELTEILTAWAEDGPSSSPLESIGKCFEGREIWLCTITNTETGPELEKPGFLVEANIHSIEVTGATAALHLIDRLLSGHGQDERVTHVLDTRAFYVVPRLNPDGPELALADRPRFIRSSTRPWPLAEEVDGLHEEDLDGDGRILMMRIRDPNGSWKPHAEEPRLMVRREPDDAEGDFYRVLWEGRIRNFDGVTIKVAPPLEGLDLNRNFPMEWAVEAEQYGAGPTRPRSPRSGRSCRRSSTGRTSRGTSPTTPSAASTCGRTPSYHDEHFPTPDLRTYRLLGEKATELTGYPAISIFHDFKYDPKQTVKGSANDWLYDHLDVYSWTTEFWSPQREAGIEDYHYIDWLREHPPEDDLKLLRWSDEQLDGKGYIEWYPFEHDQLGEVELGGWDSCTPGATSRRSSWSARSRRTRSSRSGICTSRRGSRSDRRRWSRWGRAPGSFASCSRTRAGCRRASPRRPSSGRPCGRSRRRSRFPRAERSSAASRRSSSASSTGESTGARSSGGRRTMRRATARRRSGWWKRRRGRPSRWRPATSARRHRSP